jgi:hypothetical protein
MNQALQRMSPSWRKSKTFLVDLQNEKGMALVLITHNMEFVALFTAPRHPLGDLRSCKRQSCRFVIARLAALVSKPKVNLTRIHGVFAPKSKYRALVTPAKRGKSTTLQTSNQY